MLELKRAVLTHAGKRIQALNIAGEDIEFTRIEVGSGRYTEDEVKEDALRDMTTLKSKNQQFGISSIKTIDGDTIVLRSVITNIDLPAGYTIRELGLYARIKGKPDTECLASISLAKVEDYMPTYDGENECRIICNYQFSVSDSDCVHLSYCLDPVALVEDVDAKVAELRKAIDEVKALRASFEACGLVKVTNSAAVTDSTGLALAATEKNALIPGTLGNKLAQLNTDYFANNVHAKSIAIAPNIVGDIAEIMLCAQNGNGKVNRLVSNTNLPHTLGAYHSTDYGQTWNGFSIGTPSGRERVNEFFILSHGDEGDDARTMILRFQNRHRRYTNLHINFTPDASPKMAAYAQNDAGGFDLVWTLG